MKKDIPFPKVEDVAVSVIKETNEKGEQGWNVYLLNLKEEVIENVLVSSRGYLKRESGEETTTSMLRHALGDVQPRSAIKIEPIIEEVFNLHNEYWVSFFEGNAMYDKKYIFLAETINEKHFTKIPILNVKGVLIK